MAKRVYFAFHYQDVIDLRANVVRKHNMIGGTAAAGYYDASIWEEARKTSPLALKRLINKELEYTSVTSVLIGTETWRRPWVRYEIFKSIERGNKLIGIHINSVRPVKDNGPNPFDNLALEFNQAGTIATPIEWDGHTWRVFGELDPFKVPQKPWNMCGKSFTLATWYQTYDWMTQNGYRNFNSWIL